VDKMMLKKKVAVRVKGELREVRSGEIVALIYDQRQVTNDPKGREMAAYAIGVDTIRGLVNPGARQ